MRDRERGRERGGVCMLIVGGGWMGACVCVHLDGGGQGVGDAGGGVLCFVEECVC